MTDSRVLVRSGRTHWACVTPVCLLTECAALGSLVTKFNKVVRTEFSKSASDLLSEHVYNQWSALKLSYKIREDSLATKVFCHVVRNRGVFKEGKEVIRTCVFADTFTSLGLRARALSLSLSLSLSEGYSC